MTLLCAGFVAVVFVASCALLVYGLVHRGALATGPARFGVVSFELTFTEDRAVSILDTWRARDLVGRARREIRRDYAFIVFYTLFIGGACLCADVLLQDRAARLPALGRWFAAATVVAAALDAVENWAMLRMLDGPVKQPWPLLASACASLKFVLVILALAFLLASLVAWLAAGRPPSLSSA